MELKVSLILNVSLRIRPLTFIYEVLRLSGSPFEKPLGRGSYPLHGHSKLAVTPDILAFSTVMTVSPVTSRLHWGYPWLLRVRQHFK